MRESYLIQKYRSYLASKKLSTATVDNYLTDATIFCSWASRYLSARGYTIDPTQPATYLAYVTAKTVSDFNLSLVKKNAAAKTVKRRLAGLKKFLDFAVSAGYLSHNPAANIQVQQAEPLQNPSDTLNKFKKWLHKRNLTDTTIKNYISDLRHFLHHVEDLTGEAIHKYRQDIDQQFHSATAKRKLSSLRKFGEYLKEHGRLDSSVLAHLSEPSPKEIYPRRSGDYQSPPPSEADNIRHYNINYLTLLLIFAFFSLNIFILAKLKTAITREISQQLSTTAAAQSSALDKERAVVLPLSATLKDNYGIPLSFEQEVSFVIYPSEDSREALYSTGRCPIQPDDYGNINIVIGQDCGKPVSYSLFQTYPELYLGASVGFGNDLNPRIPIKQFQLSFRPPTPTPTDTPFIAPTLAATVSAALNNSVNEATQAAHSTE